MRTLCGLRSHQCSSASAPLVASSRDANGRGDEEALGTVRNLSPTPSQRLSMTELVDADEPALLRSAWTPAVGWTWSRLKQLLSGHTFEVVRTFRHHYLPPDKKAALSSMVNYESPDRIQNVSADQFIAELAAAAQHCEQVPSMCVGGPRTPDTRREQRQYWRTRGPGAISFDEIPESLKAAWGKHAAQLYHSAFDAKSAMQYVWLSTPAHRTHTHFDSDRNAFVQLIGKKRFVLWHPNQTFRLCPFPRLHPLWHKSRADFEEPALELAACANYTASEALVVDVEPGDVLYVPPYWWHTVETLSPSLSLSTLSRWPQLYNHLNPLYQHVYYFDTLAEPWARAFMLRTFLSRLLQHAKMPHVLEQLIQQYAGFEYMFAGEGGNLVAGSGDGETMASNHSQCGRATFGRPWSHQQCALRPGARRAFPCAIDARGTPISRSGLGNVDFDVRLAWDEHFVHLPAAMRAVALSEMIEEVTAHTLGASEALGFWRECFGPTSPKFFLTQKGTEEHLRLWKTIDNTRD
jgi:hypothetical protein